MNWTESECAGNNWEGLNAMVPWWRSSKNTPSFECFMLKTFKTVLKINYYGTFVERLGRTKCIVPLSPGHRAGRSALLACGAGEHTWPQPLPTHFSPAAQSLSSRHCSSQTPSRSEKTGWDSWTKYTYKWSWHNSCIQFDLGLRCLNMISHRTSSDSNSK